MKSTSINIETSISDEAENNPKPGNASDFVPGWASAHDQQRLRTEQRLLAISISYQANDREEPKDL